MSMMQEKMYMDVDDVCAILGVSKTYAYSLMREYNKELKAKGYIVVRTYSPSTPSCITIAGTPFCPCLYEKARISSPSFVLPPLFQSI